MRGAAVRAAIAVAVAVLLALPFFTTAPSFATAHTVRQIEAKATPGIKPSGAAQRNESATHRHCDHSGDPTGPLRNRDRHRAVDVAPEGPERPLLAQDPAADHPPAAPRPPRTSRPPTAHSPAALQVFRC
ncbi:hypothetical protein ELQ87_08950 [Streptomyces griseoviridis]|uniref:Secreted protein n=1 Tax=Streptomyces griseoviridis TaxID=45398 RepID=A0A3S9ZQ35_STRGD|nr:hypothetical protein ELQ87_08950 [Streptomyces griseoviridis]QCN90854.1 hypothetical protein DDJ31_30380 [Streptomyces griseoviridis]